MFSDQFPKEIRRSSTNLCQAAKEFRDMTKQFIEGCHKGINSILSRFCLSEHEISKVQQLRHTVSYSITMLNQEQCGADAQQDKDEIG